VRDWLREVFEGRPLWMNAVMVFCAFMAFVYVPWDLFIKPVARDQEVWFGILFTGWAAKVMAVPHWFVYAAGAYGLRRMRPWIAAAGALYVAQVAFGMWVWVMVVRGGFSGFLLGMLPAAPFVVLALAFWNARDSLLARRASLRDRYTPNGEWALVTGASSGIGAEFARALAREGVSCVLTARRKERLELLVAELEGSYGVSARAISVDLVTQVGRKRLLEALGDTPVTILVNNAGVGYAGRFDLLDAEKLRAQVELNCVAPVTLTRALLPAMKERGRGAVIFTGSVAGRQPLPLHGVYAATKAFDLFLGESLAIELADTGIDVLVVEPGPVETEFQEAAGEIAHPGEPPSDTVHVALEALGRQPSVISGWFNWLRANAASRLASRPLTLHLAHELRRHQTPPELR